MSTLIDKPTKARHEDGIIYLSLESGREVNFSIYENKRLKNGNDAELNNIELSPFGLRWADLDEDLSISGLLEGRFG